ncbi:MAG: FAD-dependent oxidoreductase, partial [Verrucomicrobia bacterium]|nr:FAD-dependent oxidoreductase [Verrucomicrobiota bacterium]
MKQLFPPAITGAFLLATGMMAPAAETLFVEAESFADHGGWALDTSFVQNMGSPYLLAHGLGKPVADAKGKVQVKEGGSYRVWVRTKDWVAHWKAPGTPGRFQLSVNGKPLKAEFGTEGADWHWQSGGAVELKAGEAALALHDLTGFEGRCDAILLSNDPAFTPPNGEALAQARLKWLNPEGLPADAGEYDLVVVGGGYAGLGTAISAARQSLRVALVQDRFVLGGNGSSEIGVWAMGGTMRGKYPHLGEIVEEFADRAKDSPGVTAEFLDDVKEAVCRNEKTLSLFLGHFANGVVQKTPGGKIEAVTALDVKSGRQRTFRGKLFADCTGHGTVGALAGAAFTMQEKGHMGMSNMWYYQQEDAPQAWPETPWALPLENGDFPATIKSKSQIDGKPFFKAEWFWESGFDQHPINDLELVRDWNLRAAYGAFTALKRGEKAAENANAALKWISHVGGPRESRLLEGDV